MESAVSPNNLSTDPRARGLRQVLYISRAADGVTDAEVRKILLVSRRNNRQRDITGCLLFSGRHFAQVLEGERKVLGDLIAVIAADPRHDKVQVVVDHQVSVRRYPDWSMGVLYKLEVADQIEAILAGANCSHEMAFDLMSEVNPDSVIGALR